MAHAALVRLGRFYDEPCRCWRSYAYDTYRIYQIERGKSPAEVWHADCRRQRGPARIRRVIAVSWPYAADACHAGLHVAGTRGLPRPA